MSLSQAEWCFERAACGLRLAIAESVTGMTKHTFVEFFAGGGMARAGLGTRGAACSPTISTEMKVSTYEANWGEGDIQAGATLRSRRWRTCRPRRPISHGRHFPAKTFRSLGSYRGLGRERDNARTRSGTFWPFWKLMRGLVQAGRAPRTIVLENVYGCLTSHGGKDFAAIASALSESGYKFGAAVINASHFVPQSRPRVFFIAVRKGETIPSSLDRRGTAGSWHPAALVQSLCGNDAQREKKLGLVEYRETG